MLHLVDIPRIDAEMLRQRLHARDVHLDLRLRFWSGSERDRRITHDPAHSEPQRNSDSFPVGHGPPFREGRTHEARQARCRPGAPRLCCGGHYDDAGGVSSLPRDFLLKNQKANMIRATIKPILKTRKNNGDRKSTRLNSSHSQISYAVFCLKKKKKKRQTKSSITNVRHNLCI